MLLDVLEHVKALAAKFVSREARKAHSGTLSSTARFVALFATIAIRQLRTVLDRAIVRELGSRSHSHHRVAEPQPSRRKPLALDGDRQLARSRQRRVVA